VKEVASYVLSLSGRKVDLVEAKKGEARFAMCAACHGRMPGRHRLRRPRLDQQHLALAAPVRWSNRPSPTVATA
jgi:cytochrome c553